jgi:LysR family hydrogen peroxide-inducible transcriptional activator
VNDRQLRYALVVRDELSFSRAAVRLFVSQPSISQQVAALEDEIGFALFRRTGHGVELTESGRIFLQKAHEAVSGFVNLKDLARKLRRGTSAALTIGMSTTVSQFLFPLFVEALRPTLSNIELSMTTAIGPKLEVLIVQDVLDIGFVLDMGFTVDFAPKNRHPQLTWTKIAELDTALFVFPGHPLAQNRDSVDLAELVGQPLVTTDVNLGCGALVQSMFATRGLQPRIVAIVDRPDDIKTMVCSGMGIAILPTLVASSEMQRGDLVRIPLRPSQTVSLSLVRQAKDLGPHVEACIMQVLAAFRQLIPSSPTHGYPIT